MAACKKGNRERHGVKSSLTEGGSYDSKEQTIQGEKEGRKEISIKQEEKEAIERETTNCCSGRETGPFHLHIGPFWRIGMDIV